MKLILPLLSLFCFSLAMADHKPNAEWSWHLLSAGSDESRLSIYRGEQLHAIYNIACDLGSVDEAVEDAAGIELVKPQSSPDGLLVITCNVGAHSQQLAVIDFAARDRHSMFSVTGSYSARWEVQDGELWIEYDEPCDTGPTVECPDGYATIFVPYPGPTTD